jgi:hypothetical protein
VIENGQVRVFILIHLQLQVCSADRIRAVHLRLERAEVFMTSAQVALTWIAAAGCHNPGYFFAFLPFPLPLG